VSLDVQIRLARFEDIPQVLALERGVEGAPHWAEREYAAMLEPSEGAGVRRRLIVAERGGRPIGFIVGKVIAQVLGEIESVAVAVEARRLGVGRALCEAIIGWFRDEGAEVVELEVRAGNDGAIGLYKRLGFGVVGQRRMYYREPLEDALLMSIALVQR
jgi:ribosomal-protein-alanine N-acetyltransferase